MLGIPAGSVQESFTEVLLEPSAEADYQERCNWRRGRYSNGAPVIEGSSGARVLIPGPIRKWGPFRIEPASRMKTLPKRYEFLGMPVIAQSLPMHALLETAERVAKSNATVLVTGETGSGKEIAARAIHHYSLRCSKPWVDVNCGALPESLIEAELVGHERGAFSGADQARPGLFEMADGGTLYLDEIGELEARMQVRLLRVLDGAPFYRVGGRKKVQVDVRIVAATNRDLEAEVAERRFRSDLYHRICQFQLPVPALRERRDDIVPLARFLLEQQGFNAELTNDAIALLESYDWPGNIRELRNVVLRAALMSRNDIVTAADLELTPVAPRQQSQSLVLADCSLSTLEKDAIGQALQQTDGNRTRAADLLGISRRTLIRRLKTYETERLESCAIS